MPCGLAKLCCSSAGCHACPPLPPPTTPSRPRLACPIPSPSHEQNAQLPRAPKRVSHLTGLARLAECVGADGTRLGKLRARARIRCPRRSVAPRGLWGWSRTKSSECAVAGTRLAPGSARSTPQRWPLGSLPGPTWQQRCDAGNCTSPPAEGRIVLIPPGSAGCRAVHATPPQLKSIQVESSPQRAGVETAGVALPGPAEGTLRLPIADGEHACTLRPRQGDALAL